MGGSGEGGRGRGKVGGCYFRRELRWLLTLPKKGPNCTSLFSMYVFQLTYLSTKL